MVCHPRTPTINAPMSDTGTLASLLGRLVGARVICVGDIMLDRFVEGSVERISPEAPIPVFGVKRESEMLGGAGNVARNIAAIGAEAALISVVGDDDAGRRLGALVEETAGISATFIKDSARPTTIKTRYVAAGQQLLRADKETVAPLSAKAAKAVVSAVTKHLDAVATVDVATVDVATVDVAKSDRGVLVLSDYGKGVLDDALITSLIGIAKERGALVIVDPKGQDYSRYKGAGILTPNRQELAAASGLAVDSDDEIIAACRQVIKAAGVDAVLATRSEQGMSLVSADAVDHLPARAREVFDVSGAGDTVAAVLGAAHSAGATVPAAAALANVAAGVVVGKIGTAVAYPAEILSALHETEMLGADTKVMVLEGARDRVATWRRQGLRCGFTNGCFDLLHPGHISLLNQSKAACDKLIVGLNSDRSVRRLKGPERPIQSETSRAQVLASLAMVDLVVIFEEQTPVKLIEALRPEILVKGADYTIDQVVGAEQVRSWGGAVVLAEILDGHSTTGTIEKMGTG
jgi:D-beta-D-heptose 7-phosphate kinase / D-beta-D-heptose 1-phosphate adenosyltransferase